MMVRSQVASRKSQVENGTFRHCEAAKRPKQSLYRREIASSAFGLLAMTIFVTYILAGTLYAETAPVTANIAQRATDNGRRTTDDSLVYLKADKAFASGFDATPDW
ncbi:MAG: hypothetical protein Q8N91_01425, partial [Candidatus Omnitrophota bacterium]|nr:hypothetical protein [Candidatus Omnitrophota bacterium]